jgi:hypothetical protein
MQGGDGQASTPMQRTLVTLLWTGMCFCPRNDIKPYLRTLRHAGSSQVHTTPRRDSAPAHGSNTRRITPQQHRKAHAPNPSRLPAVRMRWAGPALAQTVSQRPPRCSRSQAAYAACAHMLGPVSAAPARTLRQPRAGPESISTTAGPGASRQLAPSHSPAQPPSRLGAAGGPGASRQPHLRPRHASPTCPIP